MQLDNQVLPAWLGQHAPVGLGLDRVLGPCGVASLHHSHAVAIKFPRITKGYLGPVELLRELAPPIKVEEEKRARCRNGAVDCQGGVRNRGLSRHEDAGFPRPP